MTKIYVVMGETGYSGEDYTTWPVMAYLNEQAANEHAAKAEARAKEIYPRWGPRGDGSWVNFLSEANEFDPNMQKDGETTYNVYGVDVADAGTQPSGYSTEYSNLNTGSLERDNFSAASRLIEMEQSLQWVRELQDEIATVARSRECLRQLLAAIEALPDDRPAGTQPGAGNGEGL